MLEPDKQKEGYIFTEKKGGVENDDNSTSSSWSQLLNEPSNCTEIGLNIFSADFGGNHKSLTVTSSSPKNDVSRGIQNLRIPNYKFHAITLGSPSEDVQIQVNPLSPKPYQNSNQQNNNSIIESSYRSTLKKLEPTAEPAYPSKWKKKPKPTIGSPYSSKLKKMPKPTIGSACPSKLKKMLKPTIGSACPSKFKKLPKQAHKQPLPPEQRKLHKKLKATSKTDISTLPLGTVSEWMSDNVDPQQLIKNHFEGLPLQTQENQMSPPSSVHSKSKPSVGGIPKQKTIFDKGILPPPDLIVTKPVLREDSTGTDRFYYLPNDWGKRTTQRPSGKLEGNWDAYLYPPPKYRFEKALRSTSDLIRFLNQYPEVELNPRFVNLIKIPAQIESDTGEITSLSTQRLIRFVDILKSGQEYNIQSYLVNSHGGKKKSDQNHLDGNLSLDGNQNLNGNLSLDGNQTLDGHQNLNGNQLLDGNLNPNENQKNLKSSPKLNKLNLSFLEECKLEKIFYKNPNMPNKEQLQSLSKELKVKYREAKKWFSVKCRSRMEYQNHCSQFQENQNEENFQFRKLKSFEATFVSDPMVQFSDGNFTVGIERVDDDDDDDDDKMDWVNADKKDADKVDPKEFELFFEDTEIDIEEVEIPI